MEQKNKPIRTWLVNNILSIISLINPIITAIIITIWHYLKQSFSTLDIILIILLAIQTIAFIGFAIWRNISYKSYHYYHHSIKPDFIVLEQTVNYKVNKQATTDPNKKEKFEYTLDFSNKRNIKCCVDRLERIPGKYIWTGKDKASLPRSTSKHQVRSVNKNKGFWSLYDISFKNCLLKGQTATINNAFPTIKNCKSSCPFVACSTEEPTKKLTFNVELGREYSGQELTIETYRSSDSFYPIESKKGSFDANGIFEYTINKPKRFRYFVISWSWKD